LCNQTDILATLSSFKMSIFTNLHTVTKKCRILLLISKLNLFPHSIISKPIISNFPGSSDFDIFFCILFGITMVICLCCVCSLEDDAYENSFIKDATMKKEHNGYQNNETTIKMGLLESPIPQPKNKILVHHK